MAEDKKSLTIQGEELTKEQANQMLEMFDHPGYQQYKRILKATHSNEIDEVFVNLKEDISESSIRESRGIAWLANELLGLPLRTRADFLDVFVEENKTA